MAVFFCCFVVDIDGWGETFTEFGLSFLDGGSPSLFSKGLFLAFWELDIWKVYYRLLVSLLLSQVTFRERDNYAPSFATSFCQL